MNNQFQAQSLNRKSYRKFTLSYIGVMCFKHVGLLWPISALDRKQVRGSQSHAYGPDRLSNVHEFSDWKLTGSTVRILSERITGLHSVDKWLLMGQFFSWDRLDQRVFVNLQIFCFSITCRRVMCIHNDLTRTFRYSILFCIEFHLWCPHSDLTMRSVHPFVSS